MKYIHTSASLFDFHSKEKEKKEEKNGTKATGHLNKTRRDRRSGGSRLRRDCSADHRGDG